MTDLPPTNFRLPDGRSGELTARVHEPEGAGPDTPTVALTHGASGTLDTPGLVQLAGRLAGRGFRALRFNLPAAEAGRRRPDHPTTAIRAVSAVAAWTAERYPGPLFVGGRSFGGRMASLFLADLDRASMPRVAGGVFLAYPLRPPGRREVPLARTEHLARIPVPTLFVSGGRDPFAPRDFMEATVASAGGRIVWIEDADHGFRIPKRLLAASGRVAGAAADDVASAIRRFVEEATSPG